MQNEQHRLVREQHRPVQHHTERDLAPRSAPTLTSLAMAAALAACGGGNEQSTADGGSPQAAVVSAAVSNPVCFYEHINYQGASFCTGASSTWIGSSWNDRVSSVKVSPGYKVQLFEHINNGGRSLTLSGDIASLVSAGFNDRTSSYKVTAPAPTPTPTPAPTPTPTPSTVASIQVAQSHLFNSDDSALVLVAGKPALVKVNVTSSAVGGGKPSGTLRVENTVDGSSVDLLLTAPTGSLPASVPEVPSFTDSYSATVPAQWVRSGLRLTAQVGNGRASSITPRVGGGVTMKFVPIAIRIADTTGQLPSNQGAHIQALFPVSAVTVQPHATYTSSRVTVLPASDAAWSDAFGKILGELADLHTLEGAGRHDHYFGFIPKRTWGLAGLAYLSGTSGVGFDMPSAPTTVRDVVAHELGHNFSLPHAACGGAGSPDPAYPYPDATLGKPGRYIWPFLADSNVFYDPRPADRHDIMSYCGGQVFSDYNYRKMQVYLTPADKLVVAQNTSVGSTAPQELLLVSGEVGAEQAELNPVKALVGKPQLPEAGPYTLRIVTASGTVEYPFAPRELDHVSSVLHFGFTIPHPGVIQSISIVRNGKTLLSTASKPQQVNKGNTQQATTAPAVQVQEANGTLRLTWDAQRHTYLTVTWVSGDQRRNLAQDLRGGTAVLSTAELPSGGHFELVLSDGLNPVRLTHQR